MGVPDPLATSLGAIHFVEASNIGTYRGMFDILSKDLGLICWKPLLGDTSTSCCWRSLKLWM